jgi:hypothetical protein
LETSGGYYAFVKPGDKQFRRPPKTNPPPPAASATRSLRARLKLKARIGFTRSAAPAI